MTLKQGLLASPKHVENQIFFNALKRADSVAVRKLVAKIAFGVKQSTTLAGLSFQEAEEFVNDAVVITISNIRDGKFQFMDFSPATYAAGVARKLIANAIRKKKLAVEDVPDLPLLSDLNPEAYLQNKERQKIVGELLQKLESTCRELITLKYFNILHDQEIIERELTQFSSINSLKSKRSQCLKKLSGLALEAGITEVF